MPKRESELGKISDKTKKIAELISAVAVIIGAAVGLCSWVSGQFASAMSSQISEFRQETKEANAKQDQQITRLELMNLIQYQPENKLAIEKMARYYFNDLDGDQYMTSIFSEWCKRYDGDVSIVMGGYK